MDAEAEATAQLNRRMHRVTIAAVLAAALVAIALGGAVYFLVDRYIPSGKICVAIAALCAMGVLNLVARSLRRVLITARVDAWITDAATTFRVDRARLDEVASLWRMD